MSGAAGPWSTEEPAGGDPTPEELAPCRWPSTTAAVPGLPAARSALVEVSSRWSVTGLVAASGSRCSRAPPGSPTSVRPACQTVWRWAILGYTGTLPCLHGRGPLLSVLLTLSCCQREEHGAPVTPLQAAGMTMTDSITTAVTYSTTAGCLSALLISYCICSVAWPVCYLTTVCALRRARKAWAVSYGSARAMAKAAGLA